MLESKRRCEINKTQTLFAGIVIGVTVVFMLCCGCYLTFMFGGQLFSKIAFKETNVGSVGIGERINVAGFLYTVRSVREQSSIEVAGKTIQARNRFVIVECDVQNVKDMQYPLALLQVKLLTGKNEFYLCSYGAQGQEKSKEKQMISELDSGFSQILKPGQVDHFTFIYNVEGSTKNMRLGITGFPPQPEVGTIRLN